MRLREDEKLRARSGLRLGAVVIGKRIDLGFEGVSDALDIEVERVGGLGAFINPWISRLVCRDSFVLTERPIGAKSGCLVVVVLGRL